MTGLIVLLVLYVVVAAAYWLWIAYAMFRTRRDVPMVAELDVAEPGEWPRLSVIVPARDEADRIEAAARTLLDEDYPNLEIVFVDDRSTDGTGEIVDHLAAESDRARALHVSELPDGWLGIRGELSREMTLEEFLTHLRDSVRPTTIRHTGNLDGKVSKVGVLAGSGGGFVENVVGTDVDVFVTGDLKHHQAHRLAHASIVGVDIGHFDSEKFIMERFKDVIEEDFGGSVTVDVFDEPTEYMRVFR